MLEKGAVLETRSAKIESLQREITSLRARLARVESINDEVAELRAAVFALTHGATSLVAADTPH